MFQCEVELLESFKNGALVKPIQPGDPLYLQPTVW